MQYSTSVRSIYENFKFKFASFQKFSTTTRQRNTGTTGHFDRYEPCYLLWKNEIPAVVWFEDVLSLHGGNMPVQDRDLNLLVQDPQEAAKALKAAGYKNTFPNPEFESEPEFRDHAIRIALPMADTALNLLPAQMWYYDIDKSTKGFLPPLHDFLDSMMEFWLNISSQDYADRLFFALCIGNLINYCYKIRDRDGNAVKDPAFADFLQPAHRELHYDIIQEDPQADSFTITKRHQYHVRRSQDIKDGLFTPQPYRKGTYRPDLTTVQE